MTETGWIIVGIIVVFAIILIAVMLRRKPSDARPGTAQIAEHTPAQVIPEPVHSHPQTIDAEPEPAIVSEVEPTLDIPPVQADDAHVVPDVEPVALAPVPVVEAVPAPSAPVSSDGDNLLKLKGVGPKIATLLKSEGVTRYAQIAAWTEADLAAIDAKLGSFAGRPKRDNWVDQARFLAAGDIAGYEAKYGKL